MIYKEVFLNMVSAYEAEERARDKLEELLGGIVIESNLFAFSNAGPGIFGRLLDVDEESLNLFVNMFIDFYFDRNRESSGYNGYSWEYFYDFWTKGEVE